MRYSITILLFVLSIYTLNAQNVSYLIDVADEAFESGNYGRAAESYYNAIRINSNIASIQYKYAESLMFMKEYKEASRWYKKIYRESDLEYPLARFNCADCLKRIGDYKMAASNFNRFYRLNRTNENLKYSLCKFDNYFLLLLTDILKNIFLQH